MKLKTVITFALLLFVAVSIVTLIAKEFGDNSSSSNQSLTNTADGKQPPKDRLIVYYFHGNTRCPTCLTLEAYSGEAVKALFPAELASGRVEWQVVNFDEPWNEHFLEDYNLAFQSLVLVEFRNGMEYQFLNLDKIWDLVDDKQSYFEYVQSSIESLLLSGSDEI